MRPAITILLAGALLAGCGSSGGSGSSSSTPAATTATSAAAPTPQAGPAKSVDLDLYDYRFEPTALRGKPGQTLVVHLHNEGKVPHTFTVAAQHVDVVVGPGQRATARVKVPASGGTGFVCRFHQARGMVGMLGGMGAASSGGTSTSGSSGGYGTPGY